MASKSLLIKLKQGLLKEGFLSLLDERHKYNKRSDGNLIDMFQHSQRSLSITRHEDRSHHCSVVKGPWA